MRLSSGFLVCAALALAAAPAGAQSTLRPSASPAAPGAAGKPAFDTATPKYDRGGESDRSAGTVVAEVDGRAITLGDVGDSIRALPPNVGNLPFEVLYPTVLEQLIRREALVVRAQRVAADDDPTIRRRVKAAAEQTLANEFLAREAGAALTQGMIQERYRRDYEGKPGLEEVRARVIMALSEADAVQAIAELKAGTEFGPLARRISRDSSAATEGDLGFLTREGLNAEIGAVAFALAPGQVAPYPVRSAGAWFVVKTEERRRQPTPALPLVREQIRQALLRDGATPLIRAALSEVLVREYNVTGKELDAEKPADR
jgi:peptidyl-prolyl cis-trans isomerase C